MRHRYFTTPRYWLQAAKEPRRAWRHLDAIARNPSLYLATRSVGGAISFYLGTYLYRLVRQTNHGSPIVIEVGAFQGLSTVFLSRAAMRAGKRVKSFELFSGLPVADAVLDPAFSPGAFASDQRRYETNILRHGHPDVVDLIVGDARESLSDALDSAGFCVAFLDVDTYEVTRDLLRTLWSRTVGGEQIVIHDTWSPGVRRSIDEFHALSNYSVVETAPEKGSACLTIRARLA